MYVYTNNVFDNTNEIHYRINALTKTLNEIWYLLSTFVIL